jgi:dihydropteroate synthase
LSSPKVMGIINLTADSFYDGGRYQKQDAYLERAEQLIANGADIIDLGAASSKPGSNLIDEHNEWAILEKPIKQIRKLHPNILISVDTYNPAQVCKCSDLGVNIINDISGGSWNENMFIEIAKFDMAYVMMHIKGRPENMQDNPSYANLIDELKTYFQFKIDTFESRGFNKIIIDPGFGFGKTLEHNFELLAKLKDLGGLGFPVMVGLSRKSMIFRLLKKTPRDSLNGTSALNMLALQNGAHILRVHDAKEAYETIKLFLLYKQYSNHRHLNNDKE